MKIDIMAANQSLKDYRDGDISGRQLSQTLSTIADTAEGLAKKHQISLKYYVDFFEKEGDQWYLNENKYLQEEVKELGEFLDSLREDPA